jgi:hypothetical protein
MAKKQQAAQNQHYVPKFILRNFLRNPEIEQVNVFSKKTEKMFTPSISGIMAERRFNDFAISDDYMASFEDATTHIEQMLLPTYRRILDKRCLEKTPEEQAILAFFVAFQFIRTRAMRDQFKQIESLMADKLEKMGGRLEDILGYEPLTDDKLKWQHIMFLRECLPDLAMTVAAKDLFLMQAPSGRSFYLGDNPVCLHNGVPAPSFYGNIGLGVLGIEIYLPLSSDLMLSAWCPSILTNIRENQKSTKELASAAMLGQILQGRMQPFQMRANLDELDRLSAPIESLLQSFETGSPVQLDEDNMDFSNSLQMQYAKNFVVCPIGDFGLAQRFMKDNPAHRGVRIGTAR